MPILPFTNPVGSLTLAPSEGGGFPPQGCAPILTVTSVCSPISLIICSCINKGYAPPSGWTLLMAIAEAGVVAVLGGSVTYNSSNETVTLNDLPESYIRPGAGGGSWAPGTTLILNVSCSDGYNTQQLAIWDNYGIHSLNPQLIFNVPVTFTTNTFPNRCGAEDLVDVSTITTKEACDQAAADNPNSDNDIVWECTTVQAQRCTERLETTFGNGNGDQAADTASLRDALAALFRSPTQDIDNIKQKLTDRALLMQKQIYNQLKNTGGLGFDWVADALKGLDLKKIELDTLDENGKPLNQARFNWTKTIPESFRNIPITDPETNLPTTKYDWIKKQIDRANKTLNNTSEDTLSKILKGLDKSKLNLDIPDKTVIARLLSNARRARELAKKLKGAGKLLGPIGALLAVIGAGGEVFADLSDGQLDSLEPLMDLLENEISMGGGCRTFTRDENGNAIYGEPDPDMEALMRVIEDATKEQPRFRSPRSLDDVIEEYFGPDPSGPSRSRFFIPKPNSQSNMDMYDSTMTISSQTLNNQLLNNNLGSPLRSFPSILAPLPNPNPSSPSAPYRAVFADLDNINTVYTPNISWANSTGNDLVNGDVYTISPIGRI